MKKELFRAIIPSNMTINDNRNNTWRHHMGKLKWLSNLTQKAPHLIPNSRIRWCVARLQTDCNPATRC